MAIKEHDFIEIEYTGTITDSGEVFDTTDRAVAEKGGIFEEKMAYGPVTICVGEGQVVRGIDEALIGKEPGKVYSVEIPPEKGFGARNAKYIQLIATSKFRKQNISPAPGLQVNIDGLVGIVKAVTGGRTLVDFNHPLSGRDLSYELKINAIVTDTKKKLESYMALKLGARDAKVSVEAGAARITMKARVPDEIREKLTEQIRGVIPELKTLEFRE
ncbi:MAG: peptidylprolyl isomerase [archaeon]